MIAAADIEAIAKPTVMVVDDDLINLEIVDEQLKGMGFELHKFSDGAQALKALEADPGRYELVLLDRMMPHPDGMEVLARMKARPLLAGIPVIMQTAASEPDQIAEGLYAGAYYYLTKPFHAESLIAIMRSALHDREQQRAVTQRLDEAERQQDTFLHLLQQARIKLRSLDEARVVSSTLAQLCPEPDMASIGLMELLVNAIEHGNLEIDYETKGRLIAEGAWRTEVDRRMSLPEYARRTVDLSVSVTLQGVEFTIRDEGKGFDWEPFTRLDPSRAFDANGRGIAMARMLSFTTIEYLGCGNTVVAVASNPEM